MCYEDIARRRPQDEAQTLRENPRRSGERRSMLTVIEFLKPGADRSPPSFPASLGRWFMRRVERKRARRA